MTNFYEILGVDAQASQAEIKIAYRKLSKKFHPDVNSNDPFFERMFLKLQESYEVLSNEKDRSVYDAMLSKSFATQSPLKKTLTNQPVIVNFSVNKTDIVVGEVFTITWKVDNADVVDIKPFGRFSSEGIEHFKFNSMAYPQVNIILLAHHLNTGASTRDYITLNNLSYKTGFWDKQLRAGLDVFTMKLIIFLMILAFILGVIIYGVEVKDPLEIISK